MTNSDPANLQGAYGSPYRTAPRPDTAAIDQGLRSYMLRVYNYMAVGLVITGVAAVAVYMGSVTTDADSSVRVLRNGVYLTQLGYVLFVSPAKWLVILSPLAFIFVLNLGVERLRPASAQLLFWLFAALVGVSLSSIFLVYTHTSITRVFFITSASFGALSLWGYTTQRDLTGFGSFLLMGVVGIVLASLVNVFVHSSILQWVVSVVGVLVFAGLTAWDTQRLKNEYIYAVMDGEAMQRTAIMGALSLYLDFINLFTLLLQLLGDRDN
ncbi:MAG: Bax inhibitor-1/YccA family protein [Xanthobacteraceae bacterium]